MQHLKQANAAGPDAPINEKSHGSPQTAGLRDLENQQSDSKQSDTNAQSVDAKRLSTLKARCALAGVSLVESTDDQDRPAYVVSRWAMCNQLDSLDAVEAWLARVTGKTVALGLNEQA